MWIDCGFPASVGGSYTCYCLPSPGILSIDILSLIRAFIPWVIGDAGTTRRATRSLSPYSGPCPVASRQVVAMGGSRTSNGGRVAHRKRWPYADLAVRLETSESNVALMVHRLRTRLRDVLRAEVAQTVITKEELDSELAYLMQMAGGGGGSAFRTLGSKKNFSFFVFRFSFFAFRFSKIFRRDRTGMNYTLGIVCSLCPVAPKSLSRVLPSCVLTQF